MSERLHFQKLIFLVKVTYRKYKEKVFIKALIKLKFQIYLRETFLPVNHTGLLSITIQHSSCQLCFAKTVVLLFRNDYDKGS